MKIKILIEHRFEITPDGDVWTITQFPYSYWVRYLSVFSDVDVIARAKYVNTVSSKHIKVNGKNVGFVPLPYYIGPVGFIKSFLSIRRIILSHFRSEAAFIFRVPSALSFAVPIKMLRSRPYGVEVVGDPAQVFTKKVIDNIFVNFIRYAFVERLRFQCANSTAASYVTKKYLQQKYPAVNNVWSSDVSVSYKERMFSISSVALDEINKVDRCHLDKPLRMIVVGSLDQNYKGVDVLLESLSMLKNQGYFFTLKVVGGGKLQEQLRGLSKNLGVQEFISFLGQISSGSEINRLLDDSDLFILPSRTEGLPRALIEAMARGLPCISTTVGGIPELLDPCDLVQPENVKELADKIKEFLDSKERRECASVRNFEESKNYAASNLEIKRQLFYKMLHDGMLARIEYA